MSTKILGAKSAAMDARQSPLVDAMRALQAVLDRYDAAASEKAGLGRNDWRCLRLLIEHGSLNPKALQQALGLTSGSITALLDRLEGRGLLRRARDPNDRRGLTISPTRRAATLLTQAHAPLAEIAERLSSRLGPERSAAQAKHVADCVKLVEWADTRGTS